MKILDSIKNNFLYGNKYKTNSEAIIISCYFNPQNNPYRVTAFNTFYESIKHLNHHIIECVIGGNMMGGIVGDMLNNNDQPSVTQQLDTMLNDNRPVSDQLDSMLHTPTDTTDYTTSNNFS
jgi:hypothetical protein